MVAVKLSVYVGEDRKLAVKLPEDAPIGMVQIEVTPMEAVDETDALWSQLLASGVLLNPDDMDIPDDIDYLSDDELERLNFLPPGTPTSEQLVDEDRGSY